MSVECVKAILDSDLLWDVGTAAVVQLLGHLYLCIDVQSLYLHLTLSIGVGCVGVEGTLQDGTCRETNGPIRHVRFIVTTLSCLAKPPTNLTRYSYLPLSMGQRRKYTSYTFFLLTEKMLVVPDGLWGKVHSLLMWVGKTGHCGRTALCKQQLDSGELPLMHCSEHGQVKEYDPLSSREDVITVIAKM